MTTFKIILHVNGGRTGFPIRAEGVTADEAILAAKRVYLAHAEAQAAQVAAIDPSSWAAKVTETLDSIGVGTVRRVAARRS